MIFNYSLRYSTPPPLICVVYPESSSNFLGETIFVVEDSGTIGGLLFIGGREIFKDLTNFIDDLLRRRFAVVKFEFVGNIYVNVISRRTALADYYDATGNCRLTRNSVFAGVTAEVNVNFRFGEEFLNLFGRHIFNRSPVDVGRNVNELLSNFKTFFGIVGDEIFFKA